MDLVPLYAESLLVLWSIVIIFKILLPDIVKGNLFLITSIVVAFHANAFQSWISQKVCTSEENKWSKSFWLIIKLWYSMS